MLTVIRLCVVDNHLEARTHNPQLTNTKHIAARFKTRPGHQEKLRHTVDVGAVISWIFSQKLNQRGSAHSS